MQTVTHLALANRGVVDSMVSSIRTIPIIRIARMRLSMPLDTAVCMGLERATGVAIA